MSAAASTSNLQASVVLPAYTLADDVKLVLHLTRNWMLYGGFSFVVFCAAVGAVKALLG